LLTKISFVLEVSVLEVVTEVYSAWLLATYVVLEVRALVNLLLGIADADLLPPSYILRRLFRLWTSLSYSPQAGIGLY
jgi:hypothetical protein